MVDVESRFLARLSQAAILAAVRCPLDHLAPQVGGNDHHPTRFANSSAPTAAAGATAAPPNQPTRRPRAAPHQSALSLYPAYRATPSAVAEPPPAIAEVASFCEEPVWTADGPGGSPLADLCVRRVDGATEFLRVERSERGAAVARQALKVTFGAAVSFRSMTAAQILADPVLLDKCVAGDWPRLLVATRACAGLGGAG